MDIIKVAKKTDKVALASSITKCFRQEKLAVVQAIGAVAVYTALKAVVLAGKYLQREGYATQIIAEVVDTSTEQKTITAVRLTITPNGNGRTR